MLNGFLDSFVTIDDENFTLFMATSDLDADQDLDDTVSLCANLEM